MATVPENEVVTGADERTKLPFLRRVRIRGYKSIAFCDVTLEPLTILVGRNASGKSNLLDALAFLHDAMESGMGEALKRRGGVRGILCKSASTDTIAIEMETGVITDYSKKDYRIRCRVSIRASAEGVPQLPVEELTATDIVSGQEFGFYTQQGGDLLADPKLSPSSVLVVRQRNGRTEIAPVDPASREIIHRELYTLADLHRLGQLKPDEEHLERQAAAAREDYRCPCVFRSSSKPAT